MSFPLRRLEYVWHVFAMVLLTGSFVALWRSVTADNLGFEGGDPLQRILLAVSYLGVSLIAAQLRSAATTAWRAKLIWLLLAWVVLSVLWSLAPDVTMRRAFAAILGVLYGLLLAIRYRPLAVLRMLGAALTIVMVASLVVVVGFPEHGIMGWPHVGAWQGVLFHKNALGRTSVLALVCFWALWRADPRYRALWSFMWLVAVVLLIGSRSASALIVALALPVTWLTIKALLLPSLSLRTAASSIGIAAILTALHVLPEYLETTAAYFGRDATLTGRVPLWTALLRSGMERPFLGHGFGSYWYDGRGVSQTGVVMSWDAPHAHNGFIDLWLAIGLVGVVMATILLLLVIVRSMRGLHQQRSDHAMAFALMYMLFFVYANTTESVLLESGLGKSIYWVLLAYVYFTYFTLPQAAEERRRGG